MKVNKSQKLIFSAEGVENFSNFYNSLMKVRARLIAQGYEIRDNKIIPPTGKNTRECYNQNNYENKQLPNSTISNLYS